MILLFAMLAPANLFGMGDGGSGSKPYQTIWEEHWNSETTSYTLQHVKLTFPKRASWSLRQPKLHEAVSRIRWSGHQLAFDEMEGQHEEIGEGKMSQARKIDRKLNYPFEAVLIFDDANPTVPIGYIEIALPDPLLPFERKLGRKYRRPKLVEGDLKRLEVTSDLKYRRAHFESARGVNAKILQGYPAELLKFAVRKGQPAQVANLLFAALQSSWHANLVPLPFVAAQPGYEEHRAHARQYSGEEVGISEYFIHSLAIKRVIDFYTTLGASRETPPYETLPPDSPFARDHVVTQPGSEPVVLVVDRDGLMSFGRKLNFRQGPMSESGRTEGKLDELLAILRSGDPRAATRPEAVMKTRRRSKTERNYLKRHQADPL